MAKGIQASDVRWATARGVIASVATVGGAVLVARGLSPGEAGSYQFAEMLVLTGGTLINAGKADTGLRFAAAVAPAMGARLARDLLRLTWLSACLVLGGTALAVGFGWEPLPTGWLPWLGLAALGTGLNLVFFGLLQGWGAYKRLAIAQALILPGRLLAGLAVLLAGGGLVGLLAVLVASQVLGAGVMYLAARPHLHDPVVRLDDELRGRLRRYRWQMALIIALTVIVWERSEFFFLAYYHNPEAIAFYGAAFMLAAFAMRLLPGIVGGLLTPRAARLADGAHGEIAELYRDGTRYLFAVAWPIALIGSCFAATILATLFGPAYAQAAPALPPLLFGAGAGAVAAAEASVKFGIERPDLLLKVGFGAAVANLTLDWLLIPRYGWVGAAWANSLAQMAAVGVGAVITCRMFGIGFPWGAIARAAIAGLALVPLWLGIAALGTGVWGLLLGTAALLCLYPLLLLASGFVTKADQDRWQALWRFGPVA